MSWNKDDITKALMFTSKKTHKPKSAIESKKPINMGIGPIGHSDTIFVREFRWTLESESTEGNFHLPPYFIKKVEVDFGCKTLNIECYEAVIKGQDDIDILKWLDDMSNEEKSSNEQIWLLLTTYDGCGNPIYSYQFHNPKIVGRKTKYDYASSEASTQKICVQYSNYDRKSILKDHRDEPPKKRYIWKARIKKDSAIVKFQEEVEVKVKARPNLTIEEKETEVSHLGGKTWIPGKSEWNNLTLFLDNKSKSTLLHQLLESGYKELILSLYRPVNWSQPNGRQEILESWVLKNVKFHRADADHPDGCLTEISYSGAEYSNPKTESKSERTERLQKGQCSPVLVKKYGRIRTSKRNSKGRDQRDQASKT